MIPPVVILGPPLAEPASELGRAHARRLRDIYRSAGWPCQDLLEIDLLAADMLQRHFDTAGHETLRVTDAGVAWLAATLQRNRSALSKHEALVERVAREMVRAGHLGGECWYVLGCDANGRGIGAPDEIPATCGVMMLEGDRLVVARAAPRSARHCRSRSGSPWPRPRRWRGSMTMRRACWGRGRWRIHRRIH